MKDVGPEDVGSGCVGVEGDDVRPESDWIERACLLETLFENGFCQTFSKCENQNETGLFLMPLYPWGRETLTKGTYTAMLVDIKEELIITEELKTDRSSSSTLRRLLNWMRF